MHAAKQLRAHHRHGTPTLVICGHINLLPIALMARRVCAGTLHLIIHGVDAWSPTPDWLANACVRRVDGFVAVSHLTKRRFQRWTRLRDDQGVVLPNCVDLSAFGPGPKPAGLLHRYQIRGKRVLLTLGRLASEERYKGFDEVLDVLRFLIGEIPNLCYVICGDGPDRKRLVAKARLLGLEVLESHPATPKLPNSQTPKLTATPKLPNSQTPKLPSSPVVPPGRPPAPPRPACHLHRPHQRRRKGGPFPAGGFVRHAHSGEGFGIVILEALACGIPVIGSKVDGSREALLNGRLGALVDPRDPKELRDTILRILRSDRPPTDGGLTSNPRSPASVMVAAPGPDHTLDTFSAARFQQRVHAILDCITGVTARP